MASKGVRTLNIAIAGAGVVGGGASRARNDFIARVGEQIFRSRTAYLQHAHPPRSNFPAPPAPHPVQALSSSSSAVARPSGHAALTST
jgi:hypothetical protein